MPTKKIKPQSPGEYRALRKALGERFQVTAKPATRAFSTPQPLPGKAELQRAKHAGRGEFYGKQEAVGRRQAVRPVVQKPKQPSKIGTAFKKRQEKRAKVKAQKKAAKAEYKQKLQQAKPLKRTAMKTGRALGAAGKVLAPAGKTGAAVGAQVGYAMGGKKGAVIGAAAGAIAPRLVARAALPVAAGAGAVDIARAGRQAAAGVGAARHVRKQAKGATKRGFKVTRTHPVVGMITGKPGIKIKETPKTKEVTRRARERAARGR